MNTKSIRTLGMRAPHTIGTLIMTSAILCSTQLAQAQSSMNSTYAAGASYVGLNAGPSDYSSVNSNSGYSNSNTNTAYSLMYGNYFISPNVGAEVGYTNFGDISRNGGTTKAEGINLSLIGKLPLGQNFNLLGKLGTTYGHTQLSAGSPSIQQGSQTGFDWSYGVGAELAFSPQVSGVLQFDQHNMKFVVARGESCQL